MEIDDQEISCHLTPLDKVELEDDSAPCHMFSIEVIASFMPEVNESAMEEEDESALYESDCDIFQKEFVIEREKLLCEETSSDVIQGMLVEMNVPVQRVTVNRIVDYVRNMVRDKVYMDRKVVRVRVEIDVPMSYNFEAMGDDDDDDCESGGSVGASKESIESLEKMRMEESGYCAICLEEIKKGIEATRMPCLHLYHAHCILNWLQKCGACPLCRSQI
ncbi:RING/U-box superfamily protein [Euphorbia peplus]|nr:RING/U-box superfamily protein [Euphorbia peplus]